MSGGVPAGWVLVPVEPTLDMKDSATTVAVDTGQCSITALNWEEAAEVWSAMLAATPTPPIEDRDADVERVARALCEYQIRQARRWDTDADVLEAMLPVAITHAWPNFMPQARAALQALGERPHAD